MGRRKFTQEFKLEAVRLLTAGNRSAAGLARDLGINSSLLYKWKRQLAEDPEAAFPGQGHLKPEEEELRRLRRELEDARQEISFLKKRRRTSPACASEVRGDPGKRAGVSGAADVWLARGFSERLLRLAQASREPARSGESAAVSEPASAAPGKPSELW